MRCVPIVCTTLDYISMGIIITEVHIKIKPYTLFRHVIHKVGCTFDYTLVVALKQIASLFSKQ